MTFQSLPVITTCEVVLLWYLPSSLFRIFYSSILCFSIVTTSKYWKHNIPTHLTTWQPRKIRDFWGFYGEGSRHLPVTASKNCYWTYLLSMWRVNDVQIYSWSTLLYSTHCLMLLQSLLDLGYLAIWRRVEKSRESWKIYISNRINYSTQPSLNYLKPIWSSFTYTGQNIKNNFTLQ